VAVRRGWRLLAAVNPRLLLAHLPPSERDNATELATRRARLAAGTTRERPQRHDGSRSYLVTAEIIRAEPRLEGSFELYLSGGGHFRARSGVIATGVAYRRLDAPGVEDLIGCGVWYGSAPAQAAGHRDQEVVLVGGANSAGQAALYLAAYDRTVTMIVRSDSLQAGMSRYLLDRIIAHPTTTVLTGTRVIAAGGQRRLETVTVADRDGLRRELRADAMYVLIGGQP